MTLPLVTAIEAVWTAIQGRHENVPDVVVTLGSGTMNEKAGTVRLGHFAGQRWQVGEEARAELFIGGEGLKRPAPEVLATLLHEAAHGVAHVTGVKDTSRQGRYHNKRFKALAEGLGLTVTEHPTIGWSPSALAEDTAELYRDELAKLAESLTAFRHPEPRRGQPGAKDPSSSRNGLTAVCGCGRKIRVRSLATWEAGPIICGVCREEFAAEEPEEG